jgi:membrane protein DedA with SNARE-associated domain
METLHYLIDFFTSFGYIAVFIVLVACGFGVPIPEDVTLVAGGVICALSYAAVHPLHIEVMIVVALSGVLIGDGIMYLLGRTLGPRVTKMPVIRRIITQKIYCQIQEKAHRYGDRVLFVARFLPGLRAPIFLTAGISHRVPLWKFLLMDGVAALISVPIWVYLGYLFAYDLDKVIYWVKHSELLVVSLIILTIVIAFAIKFLGKRKR